MTADVLGCGHLAVSGQHAQASVGMAPCSLRIARAVIHGQEYLAMPPIIVAITKHSLKRGANDMSYKPGVVCRGGDNAALSRAMTFFTGRFIR